MDNRVSGAAEQNQRVRVRKTTAKAKMLHSLMSKKHRNAESVCLPVVQLPCLPCFTKGKASLPMQFNKKKISNTFIKVNVLFSYQGSHFLKYS